MRCTCSLGRCFLSLAFAFLATNVFAQLSISLNEDSNFVLSGQEAELLGVEFDSPSGVLTPASDAGPFQFLLSNDPTQVTFGALEPAVDLDGEIVLPFSMESSLENDVRVRYGTHTGAGVFYPTGSNPPTWNDYLPLQKLIDGIFLELSHPEAGPHNVGLAANQFAISFFKIGVEPEPEQAPAYVYTGVRGVTIGSWELLESFSYDGEQAIIDFNGEQVKVANDGTYVLPDGWFTTESGYSEIEFTTGNSSNSTATPEPSSITLVALALFAPLLLCRHRRGKEHN